MDLQPPKRGEFKKDISSNRNDDKKQNTRIAPFSRIYAKEMREMQLLVAHKAYLDTCRATPHWDLNANLHFLKPGSPLNYTPNRNLKATLITEEGFKIQKPILNKDYNNFILV